MKSLLTRTRVALAAIWLASSLAAFSQNPLDGVIQELFQKKLRAQDIGPEEFLFPGYRSNTPESRAINLQRCRERPELFPFLVAVSGEWPELYREVWRYRPDYAWKRARKGDPEILGALEWSRREPILKELVSHSSQQVRAQALAMLFEHDGDAYFEALATVARDHRHDIPAREVAANALANRGKADFLLADPELEKFEGSQFAPRMQPRLRAALDSLDPTVRENAARLLLTLPADADSLRPLLPRLKGSPSPVRRGLVQKLGAVKMPESSEALGDLLDNSPDEAERGEAAIAYAFQTGPAARPAILKAQARQKSYWGYRYFDALASIGALKSEELVAPLEQLVVTQMNPQTRWQTGGQLLGSWTSEHLNLVPGLAILVAGRADELEAGQPELARFLRGQIIKGEGQQTSSYLLERLHSGKTTTVEAETILKQRLDDPHFQQLTGSALGLAVMASPSHRGLDEVMSGTDLEAQLAVLAGARLLRQPLPLDFLQRCLHNLGLKKCAGLYLAALDLPQTRGLSGAEAFVWGADGGLPDQREARLLAKIGTTCGPDRVFLVGSNSTKHYYELTLSVWPDRWEALMNLDFARFRKATGHISDLKPLDQYLRKEKVRDRPLYDCGYSHPDSYRISHLSLKQSWRLSLLMVSRMQASLTFPRMAERPFVVLLKLLEGYAERSPIRYHDFASHPGARLVCRAQSSLDALVWVGSGPVVHTTNPAKWWTLKQGKLVECQEPDDWVPTPRRQVWEGAWNAAPDWNSRYWLAGLPQGQVEVEKDRLVVAHHGQAKRTLATGLFQGPVTSTDGQWLLVGQRDGKEHGLSRIDLTSGKLERMSLPHFENLAPLAYLPERQRFLVYGGKDYYSLLQTLGLDDSEQPNFFLVDPTTGQWEQLHQGEFQPFFHSCPFQKADIPGRVWAARDQLCPNGTCTEIGRFDPNTFRFEAVARFPTLDPITPEILVHGRKLYMIHREDLLEFPLPGSQGLPTGAL